MNEGGRGVNIIYKLLKLNRFLRLSGIPVAALPSEGESRVGAYAKKGGSAFVSATSIAAAFLFSGCLTSNPGVSASSQTSSSSSTSDSSSQAVITPADGAKAAKIIFRQANPSGSFSAPSSGGTTAEPGSGHAATRVFNADGSLLADDGPDDENWPKWLKNVEIGISGANNASATNSNCARFSAASEDTDTLCAFGTDEEADDTCGADEGLFRVSEIDCVSSSSTIRTGDGGPSDGVYIRAEISRDSTYLDPTENMLVVLEYAASSLNGSPSNPTSCFSDGAFDPTNTNCSDLSWQIFMKHSADEVVQPYLLFVPPVMASVDMSANSGAGRGGSGVATKQFYLPLAGDTDLSFVQISRIKAIGPSTLNSNSKKFSEVCATNSALCVGMVFYSMTFFRI